MSFKLKITTGIYLFLFTSASFMYAQRSATASFTASVTVIDPIEIQTISDMNFASIDGSKGGTVILKPDNTRISRGEVILDNTAGVSAASFQIIGQKGYTFNISLPGNDYSLLNGRNSIRIKDFTSDLKAGNILGDSRIVKLGATLEIAPNQESGVYTSTTPFEITVNYN